MRPRLRFKEFNDDWRQSIIGNVSEVTSSKRVYLSDYVSYGIPFFRGKEISELERGEKPRDILYISREQFEKYKNKYGSPKKGDLLITAVGTIGNILRVKDNKDFYFKDGNIIWLKNPTENSEFLKICLEKNVQSIKEKSIGSSQKALTIIELKKIKFFLPSSNEQEKIVIFLSAVDEKISQLTKKHELLTRYKKGVMQKIFSQELRFKADDGSDYPNWKTECFGNIYSFKTTNSLSRECLNYEVGTVKNVHYGDVHTKFRSRFSIKNELVPYINSDIDLSKIKSDCYCEEGDLIIADASEDYADIGKCIEIINLSEQKLLAGLHTFLAKPKKNNLSKGYMSYAMQSFKVRHQVKVIAQGTKVLSISATRLSDVLIPIPDSEEQTKISNFLSAIDEKIQNTQLQLKATKQYKLGLLQQMFV